MFNKKQNNKRLVQVLYIVITFTLIFFIFFLINYLSTLDVPPRVIIGGEVLEVELAITDVEKSTGLSNRDNLAKSHGMLFVYDSYLIPRFWMKDMRFPIDIIWIKDNMVVGYEKNVKYPVSSNEVLAYYQPKTFVNYILEVNAGFVEEKGIKIGDEFTF